MEADIGSCSRTKALTGSTSLDHRYFLEAISLSKLPDTVHLFALRSFVCLSANDK